MFHKKLYIFLVEHVGRRTVDELIQSLGASEREFVKAKTSPEKDHLGKRLHEYRKALHAVKGMISVNILSSSS